MMQATEKKALNSRNIQACLTSPEMTALHKKCRSLIENYRTISRKNILLTLSELDDALAKTSEPRLWNDKGSLLMAIENYAQAAECFERAIEGAPSQWGYHYHRAVALKKCGQFEACLERLSAIPAEDVHYGDAATQLKHKVSKKISALAEQQEDFLESEFVDARSLISSSETRAPAPNRAGSSWNPFNWLWKKPAASHANTAPDAGLPAGPSPI